MPTLEEIETILADVKRAKAALNDLETRRQQLLGEQAALNAPLATARASLAANEAALKQIAPDFTAAK